MSVACNYCYESWTPGVLPLFPDLEVFTNGGRAQSLFSELLGLKTGFILSSTFKWSSGQTRASNAKQKFAFFGGGGVHDSIIYDAGHYLTEIEASNGTKWHSVQPC